MPRRTRSKAFASLPAAAFSAVAALTALGCSGSSAPAPGQVMLVLETDGGVGKPLNFDRIAVVVTDDRAAGQIVRNYEIPAAQLPGTIAIVGGGAGEATTTIQLFATDERGALRIYQAARVSLPREGARTLRVKLEAACDGIFPKVACPGGAATCASAPKVACTGDQACLEGRCVPVQAFGVKDMPAYDDAAVASCAPEAEGAICSRRGVACGSYVLSDTCGAPRIVRCGACEGEDTATTAKVTGPGLDDCGPLGADACARSLLVPGGTFDRRGELRTPARVSAFRLDKYEVTVGRFRKFVEAWLGGWRPASGSGKHTHLNGGAGNDTFVEHGDEPLCFSAARSVTASLRGLGSDVLNGGAGIEDKLDYSGRTAALTITLCVDSAAATGVGTCGNPRNDGEAAEGDAVLNTEIVDGGSGNDSITGASADDWLYGNGGDDALSGGGGNDHLDGGPGSNTLTGDAGADICQNYVQATACDLHVYTCNTGTKRDCDRAPENACETDIQTSAQHCGACAAACGNGQSCQAGSCVGAILGAPATTAAFSGPGLDDCGPNANESCATSPLVSGGTFYRGTDTANPATISDFRLDKYEVTVGRFRKFVDAWVAGWRPSAGSGKHTHLNSGAGLVNTAGGNEPGWDAAWTGYVGAQDASAVAPTGPGATTLSDWNANLSCSTAYQTWTGSAGPNEKRPQNCLSWYDLHAFCIWDGGFLPSLAEWEYAAAGGSEERLYPWGTAAPGPNTLLAIYGCYYNGAGSCTGVTNVAPVGSAPAGAAKAGQFDLAGNVWEWNLDWYQPLVSTCIDCTNLTPGSFRTIRGGAFNGFASNVTAAGRSSVSPMSRSATRGGRCARTP